MSSDTSAVRTTDELSASQQADDGYFTLGNRHDRDHDTDSIRSGRGSSMSIAMPPSHTAMDMAFTALQYLPMPLLVLSAAKQIVLANEAMGRLLGIEPEQAEKKMDSLLTRSLSGIDNNGPPCATDVLYGLPVSRLGIDLLQNGSLVWVTWEDFLDSVLDDASRQSSEDHTYADADKGDITPKAEVSSPATPKAMLSPSRVNGMARTTVHDVVVDVVFSSSRDPATGLPLSTHDESPLGQNTHVEATMIISSWALDGIQYFTLTFTATSSVTLGQLRSAQRSVPKMHKSYTSGMGSGSSSSSSGQRNNRFAHGASPSFTPGHWLPNGPASQTSPAMTSTLLSKTSRMKDAMLNAIPLPVYAMWKDESFGVPNKACIKLLAPDQDQSLNPADSEDFLVQYKLYNEDFTKEKPVADYPIMYLMKTQKRFTNMRVGMIDNSTKRRNIYEVDGEEIRDEKTGEFLGGLVVFRNVTEFANTINAQKLQNERQFEDITNMIPAMLWTPTPDGSHDFFSQRWYDYTGLTPQESMGEGWANVFQKDDVALAEKSWRHSLATGEEYITEYRCRRWDGAWRWMLGRALPMRDDQGKVVKW